MAAAVARKFLASGAEAQPILPAPPILPLSALRPHDPAKLPPISFQSADGGTHTLDEHRGHGVVLNLWATWCVPCVAEMPALDMLARTLAPQGIQVLTVSLDRAGVDAVRPFFAAHAIRSLPILLDPHSAALQALGLDGIPTTLLVNKAGLEVARLQGPTLWASPQAAQLIKTMIG